MQLTFILTCFAKYDFLVDFITEVRIALAEVILELHGSFTLQRHLVVYLAETFVKACLC